MTSFIDTKLGIYPQALQLQEKRAEILSSNLAHRNTPGYKATDIDFKAALKDITDQISLHNNQPGGNVSQKNLLNNSVLDHIKYRTTMQPNNDGNTVDASVENAAFADNSIRYLATLNILSERVKNLMLAIKGS